MIRLLTTLLNFKRTVSIIENTYIIETDNESISFVDSEAELIEKVKFTEIIKRHKSNLSCKNTNLDLTIKIDSESSNNIQKSNLYDRNRPTIGVKKNGLLTSSKNIIKNSFIDTNGEFRLKNDTTDFYNGFKVSHILDDPLVINNIVISTHKLNFTHFQVIKNITVKVPIVALEVYFTDANTNYTRKFTFSHINYSKQRLKLDRRFVDKVFFKYNIINRRNYSIRSVSTLLFENGQFVPVKGYYPNNFYMLPRHSRTMPLIGKISICFLIFWLTLSIFYLSNKNFSCYKYDEQKFIKSTPFYDLYSGKIDEREVFIKRYLKSNPTYKVEIEALKMNMGTSSNLYTINTSFKHVDIVQSYHDRNLREYISKTYLTRTEKKELMIKIRDSIFEIHKRGVIHNNISPNSIFIDEEAIYITDFEYAEFENNQELNEITRSKQSIGKKAWRAPELIENLETKDFEDKKSADLFSLTLVLYYINYSDYPYERELSRQSEQVYAGMNEYLKNEDNINKKWEINIIRDKFMIRTKKNIPFHDLVSNQFTSDIKSRYKGNRFYDHIFFWNPAKIFDFYANCSDLLENKSQASKKLSYYVNKYRNKVFRMDWNDILDDCIMDDLRKKKYYDFQSLKSLLRAVRNAGRHYKELSADSKIVLGDFPTGFVEYFNRKFPYLLSTTFYSFIIAKEDELLMSFYENMEF